MEARLDLNSGEYALFLLDCKKSPLDTAIVDDIFMIRYGQLITRSNIVIPYLVQETKQDPIEAALRIFSFIY